MSSSPTTKQGRICSNQSKSHGRPTQKLAELKFNGDDNTSSSFSSIVSSVMRLLTDVRFRWETLFMNPDTMEFKSTMFLPTATIATGQLCPNQRRMPQIGSLFAEIIAMALLLLRLPVVIIVSSPVLLQLLTGPCYLDSKFHSLLMNCGQEIFSLEDFFDSAYACNAYFWRIFAIVGNYMQPGFAQTFLNGMTAIGENSGISTFMPGAMGLLSKISSNNPLEGVDKAQDMITGGSRFGPMSLFMKFAINPIAGTHWIWRMASRIVIQIIQASERQRSIGSVFWNVLYDGRLDYEELVAKRMLNTCAGFALMAGYTSPLGNAILHYCVAGVKSTVATLDLLSVFLVDVPIISCACKQVAGSDPSNWIMHNCEAPDSLKPLMRRLIDSPNSCSELMAQTNANLTGVFNDTFSELFAGTTTIGSILDSLLVSVGDGTAGQCDNFASNPYVVTLIPEPADYWRVCGSTDLCKLRCQQQIEAFDAVRPTRSIRSSTTSQTVQSLFFPTLNSDAYNPFNSVNALIELRSCTSLCPNAEDRCFLVAGFVGVNGVLRVIQYCVPSALAQGVSKGGQWDVISTVGLTDIQFIRLGNLNGWQDAYGIVGIQDQILQICFRISCFEITPQNIDSTVLGFRKLQVLDGLIIIQVQSTGTPGTADYKCQYISSDYKKTWKCSKLESSNIWDQELYHIVLSSQDNTYLLLPYDEVPMQICKLNAISTSFTSCVQYNGFDRTNVPVKTKGVQSRVSSYMSMDYRIFIATNDANQWLTMLFISTAGEYASSMVSNSMPVTIKYTLSQSCSLNSCVGCLSLSVQRLCYAAQQCQVARCVGSQVNQLRPLCAIGGSVESGLFSILAALQGLWNMISSTLVEIMDFSQGINPPSSITWPDHAFYGLVCSLKDVIASQVSILTSAVNGVAQASMPLAMLAHGDAVDNQYLATFTLTMMATTKFIFQIALAPLYAAIAAQKVIVCQANSLIAVVSGNNAIMIGDPAIQSATAEAAGSCMTQLHGENAQGLNSGMDSKQAFVSGSTQILSQLGGLALSLPLDAIVHPLDVMFTYLLGAVIGLQDVLQTADQKNCRAPDFTARVMYKCPCGDQAVMIPPQRQQQTYLAGAYWCSTVLALLDFDGSTKYVWNPYSLAQLKVKLKGLDVYLNCVAEKNDETCVAPTDKIFEQQQISLLSVYQRCLSNYQALTWDQGSFVMFNTSLQRILRLDQVMPEHIDDPFNVSECLLEQRHLGNDNVGCLTDRFLRGQLAHDYFLYSNITSAADASLSEMVDACLTFSGPRNSPDREVASVFESCFEQTINSSGCDIPHMIWSGRSTNKVPVASQHTMNVFDQNELKRLAEGEISTALIPLFKALEELQQWNGDGLKVTLFSSEGDLLHQYADCVMQGPLGRLVLTPGPENVEKVIWSRNSQGLPDRTFDIPCSGQKLANRNGDRDHIPPFTCGSYARRSVIKYFLRNKLGGSVQNDTARQIVIDKVKKLINTTRDIWSDDNNFRCACANGLAPSWSCCLNQTNCATDPCPCPDGYNVPMSVACCTHVCQGLHGSGLDVPFSQIDGAQLAQTLLLDMGTYLQNDIWTDNSPWLRHDPLGDIAYRDSWENSTQEVADMGLFDASQPVVYYDEIRYPFKSSFWQHCTGLLQQAMWTMPMNRKTGKPHGIDKPYDPIQGQSQTPNMTYTEEFIQSLTLEAYRSSPLYWHYNVRHAPSDSEVCQRTAPRSPLVNASFQIGSKNRAMQLGFSSMTLGGLGGADCFCGWWNGSSCRIPDELCAAFIQILGFTRICVSQNQLYNSSDHYTVLASLEALLKQQSDIVYSCPALRISEHWGFLNASNGLPLSNATNRILTEGVSGFRIGNMDWLFSAQTTILNTRSRIVPPETSKSNVALQCKTSSYLNQSIADHFIDELFPSAQGVRQSMPQSYCTRYGIELARLTVYRDAGLTGAAQEQMAIVDKWKARCQYKLEELAVCNSFQIYNATGGPTSTAGCPYTLSVTNSLKSSYAVTPGCLIVLWNTPRQNQNGIYDPCICVSCAKTPNIDIPAQLTTLCRLEPFQTLVGNDVVPGESENGVPLGSGSFQSLIDKSGYLQVNTLPDIKHWALHTSIRDADLISDWWPDEWTHPVGYHVTPECSRQDDPRWKTFDASWRWDTISKSFMFSDDETNDPLSSRNSFGASGVCRTNNYGMPMLNLNTMTVCTKENANAAADPMVPSKGFSVNNWVDGSENCASDASQTPWAVDRVQNPPRQWTVGTLQKDFRLEPLSTEEWGPSCGPYPMQICLSDNDCVMGLKCILKNGMGICGDKQDGKFECTTHSQCTSDKLCAGDGLCVNGVWQVFNGLNESISFRTYSQNCLTGSGLDTWGTSIAEVVPDILNASGLCSYRSWFENRRMADRNFCNKTDTCSLFNGMQPWNFSAPQMQAKAGESAFDSGVLKIRAHPCDRDYQYFQDFLSCTPTNDFSVIFNDAGNRTSSNKFDSRTQTYRPDKRLPLIHHRDEIIGPTFGFTGVPLTYNQLNLGKGSQSNSGALTPSIQSCAALRVCGLQPPNSFKVNNVQVGQRLVLENGKARGYTVQDLLSCGVFGRLRTTDTSQVICDLDFAVVPLANIKRTDNAPLINSQYAPGRDAFGKDNIDNKLSELRDLPQLFIKDYIGKTPQTFQEYVDGSRRFVTLYAEFNKTAKPFYEGGAGTPMQLYYITRYGAYEVPFAWWFKCVWLLGKYQMGVDTVDESKCSWNQPKGNPYTQVDFGSPDPRWEEILGNAAQSMQAFRNISVLDSIVKMPGIIMQETLNQARIDYFNKKKQNIQNFSAILQDINVYCYNKKQYISDFSKRSLDYQLGRLAQMNGNNVFDTMRSYLDSQGQIVCSGESCLQSIEKAVDPASNINLASKMAAVLEVADSIDFSKMTLATETLDIANRVTLYPSIISTQIIPDTFWTNLLASYALSSSICTAVTQSTPDVNTECVCGSDGSNCGNTILQFMLAKAGIETINPKIAPEVIFTNLQSLDTKVDACTQLGNVGVVGQCLLSGKNVDPSLNFQNIHFIKVPVGITVETYEEIPWRCVQLTCTAGSSNNGLKKPASYVVNSITTRKRIEIDMYEYDQTIPYSRQPGWTSYYEQNKDIRCARRGAERSRFSITPQFGIPFYTCKDECYVSPKVLRYGWSYQFVQGIQINPSGTSENSNFGGPLGVFRLRAMNLSYYVNDVLQSTVEFYPCIPSGFNANYISLSLSQSDTFRLEYGKFKILNCSNLYDPETNMPIISAFTSANIRVAPPTFPVIEDRIISEIQNTMSTIYQNTQKSCLKDDTQTTCSFKAPPHSGSTSKTIWPDAANQRIATCNRLRDDVYQGCVMFPGEMTETLDTYTSNGFENQACKILKTENNNPLIYSCLQNDPSDACRSQISPGGILTRDMRLTGRTWVYSIETINSECNASLPADCYLTDEAEKLTNPLSACPGNNQSSSRFKAFAAATSSKANPLLTKIKWPPSILKNGDNLVSFNHMFMGLLPGYQCSNSVPSCLPNQTAIQILSNLWRCLDCPMAAVLQCVGKHGCALSSPRIPIARVSSLDGWNQLTSKQRDFLVQTDSLTEVAVPAIKWLTERVSDLWKSNIILSYTVPDFMTSFIQNETPYSYNPLAILQYEAAMQISAPNCQATGSLPDFTSCNYNNRSKDLQRFVSANYKIGDGRVINPGETLQWKLRYSQLITQNIPQWEVYTTNRGGMFMTDVLDEKWCRSGSMLGNACYKYMKDSRLTIDVLNPSLLGAFEPGIGCDTMIVNQQRVVSAGCGDCTKPYPTEYREMENQDIMPCEPTLDVANRVTMDDSSPSNLCNKKPETQSTCTNRRGILGQKTYDGVPVQNVYDRQIWSGGLPAGVKLNPLFQNNAPDGSLSNLVVRPDDIGGHFIRMAVDNTDDGQETMTVKSLPLSSYVDPYSDSTYRLGISSTLMDWTKINVQSESHSFQTLYPASVCASWDCPLRRRAFYMGLNANFRPRIPDPLRTKIIYGSGVHPTQATLDSNSATLSQKLAKYYSSNGFCACTNSQLCSQCALDMNALTGQWTQSSVISQQTCQEQLDWPYAGGELRDGSNFPPKWNTSEKCGVLDRLPPFQYTYKNSQTIKIPSRTTLDKGGVCHMGWPVVTAGPLAGCHLLVESNTFTCPGLYSQPKNVTRLRARTIAEVLVSPSRPRLSECGPLPTYRLGNNVTVNPEVSYGILKRWEASRLLANDLRRRLCGNSKECKPANQWNLATFWRSVYTAHFPVIPKTNGENQSLWTRPWVSCTQSAIDGSQDCQGTIPRQNWTTGNKSKLCQEAIVSQKNSNQLVEPINICDMDASLDKFCRVVQDARYKVFEANCIYSGQCKNRFFFYQPSTYAVDNGEFVRSTVQTFYNSTVNGACIPDQDTAEQIMKNAKNLEKCSAMKLNVLARCLQITRTVVTSIVEILFYQGQLILYLFQLLVTDQPEDKELLSAQIKGLLSLIQTKYAALFREIGDLLYSIVFDGPVGSWFIGMVQAICEFIKWLFDDVLYIALCYARNTAIFFLGTIARGIISKLNTISFGAFDYLNDGINSAIRSVEEKVPCEKQELWKCNLSPLRANRTALTLPLPTRCWVGVEPGINSLACSAADTCMQQSDFSKVICGACPVAKSMTQFGCDTLTKLCTCNVFPVDVTQCQSHEECTMDYGDVNCRYVDSYLQTSYGNVPCSQCPKPMCLINDGSGMGQCSCLLRPVPHQTCSGIGKIVSLDSTKICLVALTSAGQLSSSNEYTTPFRTLASVPCMLLNQAQSFCYNVRIQATTYTEMVVGLSLLRTGRRRLLLHESVSNGSAVYISNASIWETQSEPCRSLVLAAHEDLGILEKFARSECWRWHDIGARLIVKSNMSHAVSPFFLVSWKDLLVALLNKGALIEVAAKLPDIIHMLLLHSEFSQPMYLFMAYWTSILPNDVWVNQTFLDQTGSVLFNDSQQFRRRLLEHIPRSTHHEVPIQNTKGRRRLHADVIQNKVSSQAAYEWGQGPYSWPPNFVYWGGNEQCAVVSTAINIVKNGLDATIQYYEKPTPDPLPLWWPKLPVRINSTIKLPSNINPIDPQSIAESAKLLLSNLTNVWLDKEEVKGFLLNAPYLKFVKSLIQCNFTRIQTCADRHPFFGGVLQTILALLISALVLKILQIPYLETLLIISAIPIFLYLTYDYSPMCIPLVPTCLLKDAVNTLDWVLPQSIGWPLNLTTKPNCTDTSCFRSCTTDAVIGYSDYNDHIAWLMCEIDTPMAIDTALRMDTDNLIRAAILRKCVDGTMRNTQRLCFAITVVNSIPIVVLGFICLWLLPFLLSFITAAVQFCLNTVFTFILFVHSHG